MRSCPTSMCSTQPAAARRSFSLASCSWKTLHKPASHFRPSSEIAEATSSAPAAQLPVRCLTAKSAALISCGRPESRTSRNAAADPVKLGRPARCEQTSNFSNGDTTMPAHCPFSNNQTGIDPPLNGGWRNSKALRCFARSDRLISHFPYLILSNERFCLPKSHISINLATGLRYSCHF